jgi:hypothetical protein
MSTLSLILGESGSGKTASLRNLNPADTLLIQSIKKPLSFKAAGWGALSKASPSGNILVSDDVTKILNFAHKTKRKIIIVDDFQYILANEFMRRSAETSFQKFTDIGVNAWNLFGELAKLPDDVRVYLLAHTQTDDMGRIKIKTIGKLLDEKITLEGMVTICLRVVVEGGEHFFATKNSGSDTVKAPMGMFADDRIENDLALVDAAICGYV